jgi:hypothetical protein
VRSEDRPGAAGDGGGLEWDEARRSTGGRASSTPDEGTPRPLERPTAKSRDASLSKLSVYIPVETLKKLDVATVLLDRDKSEIIAELLDAKFSGITYYDRNATRMPAQSLTVTGIGGDPTA